MIGWPRPKDFPLGRRGTAGPKMENAMELALSQLAQTMGLTVPGLDAAGPVDKSGQTTQRTRSPAKGRGHGEGTSDSGRKAEGRPLKKNKKEEEEEGELSEEEAAPAIPPKPREPTERRVAAKATTSRAPEFTGSVDAESLLRGGGAPPPRKRTTLLAKFSLEAVRISGNKENGARDAGKNRPRTPCRYFMEGKCSKGDECTFSHAVRPNKTAEEARTEEVCRFHIAGSCLRGEGCMYSHDLSRVPCKFFHAKGECVAGTRCRFSHAPVSEEVRHQLFQEITGVRDPRLSARTGGAPDQPPALPSSSTGKAGRESAGHSWMVPNITLPPAVAHYNPFGSPF